MLQHSKSSNTKFVLTIINHPHWGHIIEPCAVKITKKQQFSYDTTKITKKNAGDLFEETEQIHQILNLIEKYSDENLVKKFGRRKERIIDFYKRIESDFVKKHIRPYIEKILSEIIEVVPKQNINLHYQGSPESLINEQPVSIIETPVEPIFNFEKDEKETRYFLTLKTNSQDVPLNNQNVLILANYPCIILLNNKIYRFKENFDSKKLTPFFDKDYIVIPSKHEKKYYETFIKNTIKKYKVKASGFHIAEINNYPIPYLCFEADWENRAVLGVTFKYDENVFFPPGENSLCKVELTYKDNNYCFKKVNRNLEKESEFSEILLNYGLKKLNPSNYILAGSKKPENEEDITLQRYNLLDWMSEYKDQLLSKGFKLNQNHFKEKYFIGKPEVSIKANEKSDWFDLKGYVFFGEHKIPFISLKNHILEGKKEYVLPDGTIGLIPDEWFEKYKDIVSFTTNTGENLNLKKHHFPLLENLDLIKKQINIKDASFKKEELPKSLTANLRPYQYIGFQWLCFLQNNKLGGCLADDMGLGKTIQALAAILKLKESNNGLYTPNQKCLPTPDSSQPSDNDPMQLDLFADSSNEKNYRKHTSIIIMPLSLIHNWMNEIKKFAPRLKLFKHTGINRPQNVNYFSRYDLILTTYGTVRSDISILKEFHFSYIILDESQAIKNAESKIFRAVKQLKGEYRLVLTGTPIENSLTDLWSQFSFLNPGMLGNLNTFKKEFVTPIEKQNNELKSHKLQNLIEPFILRRDKKHVAKELPDLTEKVHYCEMTEEQESFYERKKSEVRNLILENYRTFSYNKTKFLLLSSLTKLRLIANHPVIVENNYNSDSGKYREILDNIHKVLSKDHKVLLFSQFVKHLNLFASYF